MMLTGGEIAVTEKLGLGAEWVISPMRAFQELGQMNSLSQLG